MASKQNPGSCHTVLHRIKRQLGTSDWKDLPLCRAKQPEAVDVAKREKRKRSHLDGSDAEDTEVTVRNLYLRGGGV